MHRPWERFGTFRSLLAGGVVALAGCEAIVGIEDHPVTVAAASAECREYCGTVLANCIGDFSVYSGEETCLGVCALLPPGDPIEVVNENSVACRLRQAELAKSTEEPNVYCPSAGPSGGDTCGGECENYCSLFGAACPGVALGRGECVARCAALRDEPGFDVVAHHEGDSLECRIVHVSSATVEPETHCAHSQFNPNQWCLDAGDAPPDCAAFCKMTQIACTGADAVFESEEQCRATCAALPPGTAADRVENTAGCRAWHAHNALLDPPAHCAHAGPGGDGHCGHDEDGVPGNCVSYCALLVAADGCADAFALSYGTLEACHDDCAAQPEAFRAADDSYYSVELGAVPGTLDCRLLHATRALTDPSECTAALGGGACE